MSPLLQEAEDDARRVPWEVGSGMYAVVPSTPSSPQQIISPWFLGEGAACIRFPCFPCYGKANRKTFQPKEHNEIYKPFAQVTDPATHCACHLIQNKIISVLVMYCKPSVPDILSSGCRGDSWVPQSCA